MGPTLCFRPWREEGRGEAPAGEQGAEESVHGESGNEKIISLFRLQVLMRWDRARIEHLFHLKARRAVCQAMRPACQQEENAGETETQVLAKIGGSSKR